MNHLEEFEHDFDITEREETQEQRPETGAENLQQVG